MAGFLPPYSRTSHESRAHPFEQDFDTPVPVSGSRLPVEFAGCKLPLLR